MTLSNLNVDAQDNIKVSIITVCLNSIATIKDTIDSIDSQEQVQIEHIVIDGGSTDGTLELLLKYQKPWRSVLSSVDNGIYDAMNKGAALASGGIITFLNSDDFYADSKILRQIVSEFKVDCIGACYGDLVYVNRRNTEVIVRHWKSGQYIKSSLSTGWIPPHPTVFIKTSLFRKLGAFNTGFKIAADYDLLVRMLKTDNVEFSYIPKVFVKMRVGGLSTHSFRGVVKQNIEINKIVKKHRLTNSYVKFFVGKFARKLLQYVIKC